ncbi:DoxX family protein [Robiginitomaculum antarcticum]|uniref:DoxX family protein n=1 Tax=Robiginitomaculum antarcticum TaxID=437507 RepID=UPI000360A99A|nr:DoxX family protein [Robiginitomaculum antarcticum]
MRLVTIGLSLILAAAFVFFGAQKFGSENIIFATIANNSGIGLFEPIIRMLTGAAELATAALLLLPVTRRLGAVAGLIILLGAIGFHLSPWLGISPEGIGPGLFYMALAMFAGLIVLNVLLKDTPLFGRDN